MNMAMTLNTFSAYAFGLLLNAVWVATVLLAAIWLLMRVSRNASASYRCMIWNVGFSGMLVLPLLFICLPTSWNLDLGSRARADLIQVADQQRPATFGMQESATSAPSSLTNSTASQQFGAVSVYSHSKATEMAVCLWLVGVAFFLSRFLTGHLLLLVRSRRIKNASEESWDSIARDAADKLELSSEIQLMQSEEAVTPAVWGIRNPFVFIPELATWSSERKFVVLLHEFAHVKRGDTQTVWLQQLVAAIYWFHPAVRLALSEAKKECEHACDDLVLSTGVKPSDYASHLLEISESLLGREPAFSGLHFLDRQSLERRLTAILNPRISRRTPSAFSKVAATLLLFPALLGFAATRPPALARQVSYFLSAHGPSNKGGQAGANATESKRIKANQPSEKETAAIRETASSTMQAPATSGMHRSRVESSRRKDRLAPQPELSSHDSQADKNQQAAVWQPSQKLDSAIRTFVKNNVPDIHSGSAAGEWLPYPPPVPAGKSPHPHPDPSPQQ